MKKIFLGLSVLMLMMMIYPNQASAISLDPTPSISNVQVQGLKNNKWTIGQLKTITWDSVGVDEDVHIWVCGSASQCLLGWSSRKNDGIESVKLPSVGQLVSTGDYYIKVGTGTVVTPRISANSSTFTVVSPTTEETQTASNRIGGVTVDGLVNNNWIKNQTKTIKWATTTAGTATSKVDIILCQDHPYYNCWPTMEMNTPNDGSQLVQIWNDIGVATTQYPVYAKIRSVGISPQKVGTSTWFTVRPPISDVRVDDLETYNTWTKGTKKIVRWFTGEPSITKVDIFICKASTGIELSKPNERCRATMNGTVISTNTINDGIEEIKIPNDPNFFTPANDYEVFVRSLNSNGTGASSTDRFRIGAPLVN